MQHLLNIQNTRQLLLAGKAIVTFQSKKTGNHFTFRITDMKPDAPYMVSVLTGTDNEGDYTYIGHIFKNSDRVFHPGKKSKISSGAACVKAFDWVFSHIMQDENSGKISENVNIYHEGVCCKCGRKLTTPESIERGLGPECAKK